jgi:two-component sensor histidine kinase
MNGRLSVTDAAAFDGRPGTAAVARDFASEFLARASVEHAMEVDDRATGAVLLVVSELITNAGKYAPGPFLLELELTAGTARVTVWDTDPVLPVPREADPQRIGQHGLEIVRALSLALEIDQRAGGKRISALIGLG